MTKILLGEGDFLTAELLALTLKFAGFEVIRVSDADTLLKIARQLRPALILANAAIADIGGCALCKVIRADSRLTDIACVLFGSSDEDDVRWREAGADDFLQKPIDIRTLAHRLRGLISNDNRGNAGPELILEV